MSSSSAMNVLPRDPATVLSCARRIALKVPAEQFDAAVIFYRDVMRYAQFLTEPPTDKPHCTFVIGDTTLLVQAEERDDFEVWSLMLSNDTSLDAYEMPSNFYLPCPDPEQAHQDNYYFFWLGDGNNQLRH